MNTITTKRRPLVEVTSLSCVRRPGRPDEVVVLAGFDLRVLPGELVALVGPSVSGKTTLLRVLAGLDAPARGRARVGEIDLVRATAADLEACRRLVSYVSEQPEDGLWPSLTVLENVQAPMLVAGVAARERRRRSTELVESFGLSAYLAARPASLAGGGRLRLALAVALASRPALVLLDDPLAELDAATARDALDDLIEQLRGPGTSLLLASRSRDVTRHVERVVWMGSSTAALPPREAFMDA